MLKHVDLCAGSGAFSLVLTSHEISTVVYANDYEPKSKILYDANFTHKQTLGDVNTINIQELPQHDILTAGFPCQPFSIAGERKGMKDERSNVFWTISNILDYHKPRFFILENVKNLLTHDNKKTFQIICEKLTRLDYFFKYKLLDTCKITDIPHHRERIYIVGFKNKKDCDKFSMDFPIVKNRKLSEFLEKDVSEKYYYKENLKVYQVIKDNVVKKDTFYQYRRTIVRENKSNVCPTLTANAGGGGHNVPLLLDDKGVRKLTPKECFNLQGFPKNYNLSSDLSDSALYKMAGNAISIPVLSLLCENLKKII